MVILARLLHTSKTHVYCTTCYFIGMASIIWPWWHLHSIWNQIQIQKLIHLILLLTVSLIKWCVQIKCNFFLQFRVIFFSHFFFSTVEFQNLHDISYENQLKSENFWQIMLWIPKPLRNFTNKFVIKFVIFIATSNGAAVDANKTETVMVAFA